MVYLFPANMVLLIRSLASQTGLLDVYNDWTLAVDQGYGVNVIYLDYKKAFDSVPHCHLIKK